jgi:RNA polymerase sigma-70 factor, ECF subfamily
MSGSLASRLFEQHGPAVRRYLHRHLRESAAAEDLCQEVFLRVVRAADDYQARERDRAWVFRIARNVLVDHQRRRARTPENAVAVRLPQAPSQAVVADVNQALARVPADDRDAFLLAEIGGLTYEEIALLTESTVAAVRSRIYRARLALRDLLMPPAPLVDGAQQLREDDDR